MTHLNISSKKLALLAALLCLSIALVSVGCDSGSTNATPTSVSNINKNIAPNTTPPPAGASEVPIGVPTAPGGTSGGNGTQVPGGVGTSVPPAVPSGMPATTPAPQTTGTPNTNTNTNT